MSILDILQAELRMWKSPENRSDAIEAATIVTVIVLFYAGWALWQQVDHVADSVFSRHRMHEVSPAWSLYVADRLQAGDISCERGPQTVRIGSVESVWVGNYPYSYGVSPDHGVMPDDSTTDRLYQAHMQCIERRILRVR